MKKIITFPNFIAFVGILAILLGFIPCIIVKNPYNGATLNIFQSAFGHNFLVDIENTDVAAKVNFCIGLFLALLFAVIAIVLCIVKRKMRFSTLLAIPFFIASGVLFCCADLLVYNSNVGTDAMPVGFPGYEKGPAVIAIGVLLFVCAAFCLFDFIGSLNRPSKKEAVY